MRLASCALLLLALSQALSAAEVDNPYGAEDLYSRPRASKKHDRVTITIDVTNKAKHEATVDTTKDESASFSLSKLFNKNKTSGTTTTEQPLYLPGKRSASAAFESSRSHKADGSTESKNELKTEISGSVIEVLPNGHLVVEAKNVMTIGEEEQSIVFTGVVDPRMLDSNNVVDAKYVMERNVKFVGKGDVSQIMKRGWFAKAYDYLNPM